MMMTGRVLLVCALCVLWCGAGGGYAWALSDDLHKQYYGANSTYCTKYPTVFNCNNKNENKDTLATDKPVTERSGVEREDGKGDQKSESRSPDHTSHVPGENVSAALGKDRNTPDANLQRGKGTENTAPAPPAESETEAEPGPVPLPPPPPLPAPTAPSPPPEPSNVPNSTNPDQLATLGGTTGIQSTHQQQSQPPASEETTATGDSSPEPETAAASDAMQSTPAGGDDEPTSPSPDGQAAASGPGENSAAAGTPDGTPPSVAAVTHDDNTNTTDTATSEGNSTAASMPAPLSSAPTKSALDSSVGNDACFHDTCQHAWLLLAVSALTYTTLG
ncbi:mucin-associated surface protein (MASP), putative [Trypanosoma cruzi marinkellei]|uniref:Mucin-associated surface protein (MASP), putative n=1 Tax=Trypanosoma cruzi marinkellei TaxID=85056 RepID=K2MU71_TRYCR|nr:mucin-associated surface protein (MASP), putative [Trypanosoma cruzi marinkellei]